ncbi:MAG: hypothetical protein MJB12_20100 [Firmicutes bacterium]|nr:hypothetical protein [Bacillota bacterium]
MVETTLTGVPLFIETDNGRYINFKPNSFRLALGQAMKEGHKRYIDEYLRTYKKLGLIVAGNDRGRFSNTQRIKNRTMRVITVRKDAYECVKELLTNLEKRRATQG